MAQHRITQDDIAGYNYCDPERDWEWNAQVTEVELALGSLVDEILADGEPGTTVAEALEVALTEMPRSDSGPYRMLLDVAARNVAAERSAS